MKALSIAAYDAADVFGRYPALAIAGWFSDIVDSLQRIGLAAGSTTLGLV